MDKNKEKRPLRSRRSEMMSMRLPLDIADELRGMSTASGLSMAAITARALRAYFDELDREEDGIVD